MSPNDSLAILHIVDAALVMLDCGNPYLKVFMATEFRSTHLEFQQDIESMFQWLESLGIGIEQNRVAGYRKTFATIAEHIQNGTVSELRRRSTSRNKRTAFTMRAN